MAEFEYSPDMDGLSQTYEESHSDVDDTDHDIDLQSAYERRQAVQERQIVAINIWRKKAIFSACLLIVTSGFLLFSEIWYANVVGIAGSFLGIYGAIKKNTEFVFVYMVLLGLEAIKNIGIFIYYINEKPNIKTVLLLIVCCLEEFGILPISIYYAFKLYRTLTLENDDQIF